jgi:hypothetical protein
LLDAGAQILELRNREVAETWLELCTDIDAAIYFDETLEGLTVLKRDTTTERLVYLLYTHESLYGVFGSSKTQRYSTNLKFSPVLAQPSRFAHV